MKSIVEEYEAEWRFRLTAAQRYCNPLGIFVLVIGLAGSELVLCMALLRWPHGFPLFTGLMVIAGLALYGCLKGSFPDGYSVSDELVVAIQGDRLGYGTDGKMQWMPSSNILRLNKGVLGCSVLGLISGHTLTMPTTIIKTEQFRSFWSLATASRAHKWKTLLSRLHKPKATRTP